MPERIHVFTSSGACSTNNFANIQSATEDLGVFVFDQTGEHMMRTLKEISFFMQEDCSDD